MRRDRLLKSHLRFRFVVTLKTGETFDALLVDADARVLELADAWLITSAGRNTVDGNLFIERAHIAYMQSTTLVQGAIAP